jgi:hypothetical protein
MASFKGAVISLTGELWHLVPQIKAAGATVSNIVHKRVKFVCSSHDSYTWPTQRVRRAAKLGLSVVKPEYLDRCLQEGIMPAICPEDMHSGPQYFTPKPPGGSQGATGQVAEEEVPLTAETLEPGPWMSQMHSAASDASVTATRTLKPGDVVEAQYDDEWWPAVVYEVDEEGGTSHDEGGRVQVQYEDTSYGWVEPSCIRPSAPHTATAPSHNDKHASTGNKRVKKNQKKSCKLMCHQVLPLVSRKLLTLAASPAMKSHPLLRIVRANGMLSKTQCKNWARFLKRKSGVQAISK